MTPNAHALNFIVLITLVGEYFNHALIGAIIGTGLVFIASAIVLILTNKPQ